MFRWVLDGEFDQLRELLVVLFEEPEGPQGLNTGGDLRGIGELARCEGVLVDSDCRVGCLGCVRGGFGVVMRLARHCQQEHSQGGEEPLTLYLDQRRRVHDGSQSVGKMMGSGIVRGAAWLRMAEVAVDEDVVVTQGPVRSS